ncbi:BQ5605_C001g00486 [Microbotryum silenes-dioicae]|uniref:Translation initiation factor eIF2B subunit epsilon n=1 Tax=Microbotryum silenes-dioicae TaxID=796604 RepID=A0A2X0P681_9BASI|nr:BQ5605_C001g00486 [Microbotryum silenes-dioicae]
MASKTGTLSKEDTKQEHPLQAIVLCAGWGEEERWGPLVRRRRTDQEEYDDLQVGGEQRPWVSQAPRRSQVLRDDGRTEPGLGIVSQCLLPLLGSPLLAWTLECLTANGVEQIFVFVQDGVEQVKAWLACVSSASCSQLDGLLCSSLTPAKASVLPLCSQSTFQKSQASFTIVVRPTKAATPGDVLREVDSLQILAPADFLIVQAGYVGNLNLKAKVTQFAARRKADPNMCMSCVVAPVETRSVDHATTMSSTTPTFAILAISGTHQLMQYEQSPLFPALRKAKLPREALDGGKELQVRADLESVGVAICSVEVPPLFTENFDYQTFYPDFVNGILTSDLLGKTIGATVVGEDPILPFDAQATSETSTAAASTSGRTPAPWAAVVGNTKSYDAISRAILSRRAYPLAPDESLPEARPRFEQRRARVYYGSDVDLSRTCRITSTSLIGSHVAIGNASLVQSSVLDEHVHLGSNASVVNSYVFEGANIGDRCVVQNSIIGEDALIGERSVIEGGCMIAAGVTIGEGSMLRACRVSLEEPEEEINVGENHLAPGSTGYLWPTEDAQLAANNLTDDEGEATDSRNLSLTRLGRSLSHLSLHSTLSSLSSLSRTSSATSLSELDEPTVEIQGLSSLAGATTTTDFLSECHSSLERSFAENHTVENAAIELKTLRMASNVPLTKVRQVVIPFVLKNCLVEADKTLIVLERWGGLIANLTAEQEEGMKDSLLIAQRWVAEQVEDEKEGMRMWLRVLKAFYEADVVDDESVFAWYKSSEARTVGGEVGRKLWAGAKPFLEAIAQDSDEDSDEDDE